MSQIKTLTTVVVTAAATTLLRAGLHLLLSPARRGHAARSGGAVEYPARRTPPVPASDAEKSKKKSVMLNP